MSGFLSTAVSVWLGLALLAPTVARAQAPKDAIPAAANPFALKFLSLIEPQCSFAATLVVTAGEGRAAITYRAPAVAREGSYRITVDLAALPHLKAGQANDLRANGLDKVVAIARLKEKQTALIYPSLRSWVQVNDLRGTGIVTTEVVDGSEVDGGKSYSRRRVVLSGDDRQEDTWTVLSSGEATCHVPHSIRLLPAEDPASSRGITATLRFEDVTAAPQLEARWAEAPEGYRRFPTLLSFQAWVGEKIAPR